MKNVKLRNVILEFECESLKMKSLLHYGHANLEVEIKVDHIGDVLDAFTEDQLRYYLENFK